MLLDGRQLAQPSIHLGAVLWIRSARTTTSRWSSPSAAVADVVPRLPGARDRKRRSDAGASVLRKAKLWERINRRLVNDRQRLVINRIAEQVPGFLGQVLDRHGAPRIRELLARGILIQNPGIDL